MSSILYAVLNSGPAKPQPKGLTAEKILSYTEGEIRHWQTMVDSYWSNNQTSGPRIRIDECLMYLDIWIAIQEAQGEWDKLNNAMRSEVLDRWFAEFDI